MIKSIRYFLLISLLLSITIASAINGIGNYLLDEQSIQPYLDSQLIRISSLINIINRTTSSNSEVRAEMLQYLQSDEQMTKHKFLFQVWDEHGNLLMHSSRSEDEFKNAPLGFSDKEIRNDDWRIYALQD